MGMLYLLLLLILLLALTLVRWSYAGLNEPISDNGGPENAFVYPHHISRMALTLRRWPYTIQNEPIPVAQYPGNNGVVQGGQLVGYSPPPSLIPQLSFFLHANSSPQSRRTPSV